MLPSAQAARHALPQCPRPKHNFQERQPRRTARRRGGSLKAAVRDREAGAAEPPRNSRRLICPTQVSAEGQELSRSKGRDWLPGRVVMADAQVGSRRAPKRNVHVESHASQKADALQPIKEPPKILRSNRPSAPGLSAICNRLGPCFQLGAGACVAGASRVDVERPCGGLHDLLGDHHFLDTLEARQVKHGVRACCCNEP